LEQLFRLKATNHLYQHHDFFGFREILTQKRGKSVLSTYSDPIQDYL